MLVRGDSLAKSMSHYLIEQIARARRTSRCAPGSRRRSRAEGAGRRPPAGACGSGTRRTAARPIEAVDACFVFIGAAPRTDWLDGVVARDERGFILAGPDAREHGWPLAREPYALETSVPGVFVAGDVRARSIKRVASAVGEGSMAVSLIHEYLAERMSHPSRRGAAPDRPVRRACSDEELACGSPAASCATSRPAPSWPRRVSLRTRSTSCSRARCRRSRSTRKGATEPVGRARRADLGGRDRRAHRRRQRRCACRRSRRRRSRSCRRPGSPSSRSRQRPVFERVMRAGPPGRHAPDRRRAEPRAAGRARHDGRGARARAQQPRRGGAARRRRPGRGARRARLDASATSSNRASSAPRPSGSSSSSARRSSGQAAARRARCARRRRRRRRAARAPGRARRARGLAAGRAARLRRRRRAVARRAWPRSPGRRPRRRCAGWPRR